MPEHFNITLSFCERAVGRLKGLRLRLTVNRELWLSAGARKEFAISPVKYAYGDGDRVH